MTNTLCEIANFYKITPLITFRETPGVSFEMLPREIIKDISGVDKVVHKFGAFSPNAVGEVKRPWYTHYDQVDNLMVTQGRRFIELYFPKNKKLVSFELTPEYIAKDGKIIHKGAAVLTWYQNVFHRIKSDDKLGSVSINFAKRTKNFDIKTNFSIYSLDTETGESKVIREGFLDQATS